VFPILPFLAWTGGIAAGARVVSGVVRGAGELVRGRPRAALVAVFDGVTGPVRLACEQLGIFGKDAYYAVVGKEEPDPVSDPDLEPQPSAHAAARRRRARLRPTVVPTEIAPSENGPPL